MMKEISGTDVPIEYAPIRPADVRHCKADINKARNELGFNPNDDIFTGLKEYFPWFKADRMISDEIN